MQTKPVIRVRNRNLSSKSDEDYTLWTSYVNREDGEMVFVRVYDDLAHSRFFIEFALSELIKELRLAQSEPQKTNPY